MGILTKKQIVTHLGNNELIINANKNEAGDYIVEPASYDLRVGYLIWKELIPNTKNYRTVTKQYQPNLELVRQETVTLQPGQVMFVITLEEVKLPKNICGTVYAKNRFSRDGILAFTTGHVDPGIRCPIVIRLINLRAIPYVIKLGEPIYTIVFHELCSIDQELLESHKPITMEETLRKTRDLANAIISNALNDLTMTQDFVKKDEIVKILLKTLVGSFWKIVITIFTLLGATAAILKIIEYFNS